MSRLRIAVLRLAAIDCGVLPPRAGGAAIAACAQRPPAGADGESGEAKMPFEILTLSGTSLVISRGLRYPCPDATGDRDKGCSKSPL